MEKSIYVENDNIKEMARIFYENYEEDVLAFNAAVESFLADIDPEWTDEEKALAVHDMIRESTAAMTG